MNAYIRWIENDNGANVGCAHVITNNGNIYWNILDGKLHENTAIAFYTPIFLKKNIKKL